MSEDESEEDSVSEDEDYESEEPESEESKQRKKDARPRPSQYFGVYWNVGVGKWCTTSRLQGFKSAYFTVEEQAARHYDAEARRLLGANAKLNFPQAGELRAVKHRTAKQRKKDARPRPSQYFGVYWKMVDGKWYTTSRLQGFKSAYFTVEEQAARHYDAEARRLLG
eukprot:COSAG02_NODE_3435_length_6748_cov_4.963303_1_plen_166_part_10